MTTPAYIHLKAEDYPINFPGALDTLPVMVQKRHYWDDWEMNRMFEVIVNIQTYLIANKTTIEA